MTRATITVNLTLSQVEVIRLALYMLRDDDTVKGRDLRIASSALHALNVAEREAGQ